MEPVDYEMLAWFDAIYPCPNDECQGVVVYRNGYWECTDCSLRTKDTTNRKVVRP
jgi:Zn-finger protein